MSKVVEITKQIEIVTEELDYGFVTTTDEEGRPYEIIYKGENTNFLDAYPIAIEVIEKEISRIKAAGCNYISFDYDVDHYQYTIEGYKVETK
jgi:hypothetical protein